MRSRDHGSEGLGAVSRVLAWLESTSGENGDVPGNPAEVPAGVRRDVAELERRLERLQALPGDPPRVELGDRLRERLGALARAEEGAVP